MEFDITKLGELPDDALLSEEQLAAWQGRSQKTIARERVDGSGPPFIKFSRNVRYRVGDVREHYKRRTVRSTAEGDALLAGVA